MINKFLNDIVAKGEEHMVIHMIHKTPGLECRFVGWPVAHPIPAESIFSIWCFICMHSFVQHIGKVSINKPQGWWASGLLFCVLACIQ